MSVIACVIPAYNEAAFIADVISAVPDYVSHLIVVNDASTDDTEQVVDRISDARISLINHAVNQGVGGATISGYRKALELGADIVVKVDADGQIDPGQIKRLIAPIERGEADYCKGVRFHDAEVIRKMPMMRLVGNLALSFLTKAASGYWNIFDPTNGFTAIARGALRRLRLERLNEGFFFESDMLCNLYLADAVVVDVPAEVKYAEEKSHLSLTRTFVTFPFYLLRGAVKRILWRYFIRDFSAFSAFFLCGGLLFSFGLGYGLYRWIYAYVTRTPTLIGTVMVSMLPLILGFQLLLQAAVLDIHNVPKEPLQHRDT